MCFNIELIGVFEKLENYILLGSALIIAGSASLNNFIDRDIDPLMERTKSRPTVTGKISFPKIMSIGFAFIIRTTLLLLTTFTAGMIGLIGVFSYVVLYSIWFKRRYVSNTVVGSISGAVLPLIGWLALGLAGYKMKDDLKWAKLMFVYYFQYLTIAFVAMVILTVIYKEGNSFLLKKSIYKLMFILEIQKKEGVN
ncbi:hypothetical protein CEW92_07720 [Bacillaceae bacterium SAS-127]|nr:hypothetical protein CEW92_07720 [Bacillaceae bacterium SAS-127]